MQSYSVSVLKHLVVQLLMPISHGPQVTTGLLRTRGSPRFRGAAVCLAAVASH